MAHKTGVLSSHAGQRHTFGPRPTSWESVIVTKTVLHQSLISFYPLNPSIYCEQRRFNIWSDRAGRLTCDWCSSLLNTPCTCSRFLATPTQGSPDRTPRWHARPNSAKKTTRFQLLMLVLSTTSEHILDSNPLIWADTPVRLEHQGQNVRVNERTRKRSEFPDMPR